MAEWKKTPSYADAKAEETLKELAKKKQVWSICSRLEALKISLQVFHSEHFCPYSLFSKVIEKLQVVARFWDDKSKLKVCRGALTHVVRL